MVEKKLSWSQCFLMTNLRKFRFLIVFKRSFPLQHMFFRCLFVLSCVHFTSMAVWVIARFIVKLQHNLSILVISCYILYHRWLRCGFYFQKMRTFLIQSGPFSLRIFRNIILQAICCVRIRIHFWSLNCTFSINKRLILAESFYGGGN